MANEHGTIQVLITSIDGRITHPFRPVETVENVRQFGYDRLVQDKSQIPFANTWIELGGKRLDNNIQLATLVTPPTDPKGRKGDDPDLTLTLAWTQQGGTL